MKRLALPHVLNFPYLPMLTLLPYDIVCEILSHLSVLDILRTRRVCKCLAEMTFHHAIWNAVYQSSPLLLKDGSIGNQTSHELERALVRATKLSLIWTAHPHMPSPIMSRCLHESYPVFSFEAALVGGRYLLTVERKRLCLFDLDATQRDGLKSPLLAREAYWERNLISTCGMLCYQTNARHDNVHVAFTQRDVIAIVKIQLSDDRAESELVAEIPAESVIKMCLRNNFLFFAEDFLSPHQPTRLYHVPSGRLYNLPMHEHVLVPSDIEDLQVHITENHLLLMHSDPFSEACTWTEVYELPHLPWTNGEWLTCSHKGQFPFALAVAEPLRCNLTESLSSEPSILFLALAHGDHRSSLRPPSRAHLLEAVLSPSGKVSFKSVASTAVNIDSNNLRQTKLFSSSRSGACLAVSCTLASSTYQTYHVQYGRGGNKIDVATLCPPEADKANRHIIGFDGFRGRLCWVRGWCPSKVHIIDYV